MKTVSVEVLTRESFSEFGSFRDMLNPMSEKLGAPPVEFFRDMLAQSLGLSSSASYSNCRVEPRPFVIDSSEHHNTTMEMLMPLDGDTLMHFAPASLPGDGFPAAKTRVFRVPLGTMVVIKPGTWHHAPFCCGDRPVNVLVALPERTYVNDCQALRLEGEERISIKFPPSQP